MTNAEAPVKLTPSIVGRAEKAHNAILFRALTGTGVDEKQWITLVLALRADERIARADLIELVATAARYKPSDVEAAISALTVAGLLTDPSDDGTALTVTAEGRVFVESTRAKTDPIVDRAYGVVPAEDLATAGRVLTTITATLSEELGQGQHD